MSREEILTEFIVLNLKNLKNLDPSEAKLIYIFPARTGRRTTSCVIEVPPGIRSFLLKEGLVFINYSVCRISDYIRVLQCFKCLAFGHFAAKCRFAPLCGHCAGGHETKACPRDDADSVCGNCKRWTSLEAQRHSALDSRYCPILRKRKDERIKIINYG